MQNESLLLRHQKKLSVYFALFVLASLWATESIFLVSSNISNTVKLIHKLESRFEGVRNILENRLTYLEKVQGSDAALKRVVEKTLEWASVYENNTRILGSANADIFANATKIPGLPENIAFSEDTVFYGNHFEKDGQEYFVILESPNEYSIAKTLHEFFYFLLFSLPFSIFFYFIGYFFVGRNLRPIRETMHSLEDFSSNINHEIKTPLSEIISTLDLAKRMDCGYSEAVDESLGSAKRIGKILDSMQGLLQLVDASYKRERLDLAKEIQAIAEQYASRAKEKDIRMRFDFDKTACVQKINRAHLDICVGNIIKNAIKYSPANSEIEISFHTWILKIRDHGIGISPENLPHIFDRYFRENYTKEEWLWLWLALVNKITLLHGWKIGIESKKDFGTTVELNFLGS